MAPRKKQPNSQVMVGITGADGFIGKHLRACLKSLNIPFVCATRATYQDQKAFDGFLQSTTAIVDLAGVNRGDALMVEQMNLSLAETLTAGLLRTGVRPHLIFASSIHAQTDSAYGRGKRKSSETIKRFAEANECVFTNLVLPHVFGEYAKPFYNSVVATFCHQLANNETARVEKDIELELVHAQFVAKQIVRIIENSLDGEIRLSGKKVRVSELLQALEQVSQSYSMNLLPSLKTDFDLDIFNTFRSYLFPSFYPRKIVLHSDDRGALFEAVKGGSAGQVFLSTTHPGITRGNHFHLRKVERFVVLKGAATVRLRAIFSDKITSIVLRSDEPSYLDIPTLHTHQIENTGGGELLTLFWVHELFDPARPDTYAEPVKRAA